MLKFAFKQQILGKMGESAIGLYVLYVYVMV